MIKDPYIGMPIVLGRPSKPASNKPCVDSAISNNQMPTLPAGHPAVNPGTQFPTGHPNCDGMEKYNHADSDDKTYAPSDNFCSAGDADNSEALDNINGNFDSMILGSLPAAMAYVPMQQWKNTYSPSEALTAGTVFPELNLPFQGYQRKGART